MSNYKKFIRLILIGYLASITTMVISGAILGGTLDPLILICLGIITFIFSFVPVLLIAITRIFLISKLKNPNTKLLVTIIFGLLFGSIGNLLYPVVILVTFVMAYYGYYLEDQHGD